MNSIKIFPVLLLATTMIGQVYSDCGTEPFIVTSVPPHQPVPREEILFARLSTVVKVGNLKVGDRVAARVSIDYTKDGAVLIPRGSVISGHITEAHKRSKADQESRLAFTFGQIRLKGGKAVPFGGQIVLVEQRFTLSECLYFAEHSPDNCDSYGGNCHSGDLVLPDYYHLNSTIQQSDGEQGVLLSSTKHDINLGWDIQLGLRLP